ncbi:hypothetical protein [Halorarius litoreus]|uniref:hypothetical protein n=1 Tax=Halorarius litoreus TaxID=2962676 RepID=UPI0020CD4C00|nr:hypothetical protein [Halorarius litoreus]
MATEIGRPRTLSVARAVAFGAAAVAVLVLSVLTLVFLAVLGVFGLLSLTVFGGANALVVTLFGLYGLLVAGIVLYSILWARRRVDQWLVETASRPDPLEDVTARYLDGETDEAGLERDIEQVIGDTMPDEPAAVAVGGRPATDPPVAIHISDTDGPTHTERD